MKEIKLTQGKSAIVDEHWFDVLSKYKWYAFFHKTSGKYYASRREVLQNNKKVTVLMHRVIMNAPKGMMVDHIDGNSLNNHPKNLRLVTNSQNLMNRGKTKKNTSGFKGVNWDKVNEKWRAQIAVNGKKINLGYYASKELAYQAYCEACYKYHDEFAHI